MADSFVLRFPLPGPPTDQVEWLSVDGGGSPVGASGRGTLAEAAVAAGSRRLVVIEGEDQRQTLIEELLGIAVARFDRVVMVPETGDQRGLELEAPHAIVRNSFRADLVRLKSGLLHHDTDAA